MKKMILDVLSTPPWHLDQNLPNFKEWVNPGRCRVTRYDHPGCHWEAFRPAYFGPGISDHIQVIWRSYEGQDRFVVSEERLYEILSKEIT